MTADRNAAVALEAPAMGEVLYYRCHCGAMWAMASLHTALLCPACGGQALAINPGDSQDAEWVYANMSTLLRDLPDALLLGEEEPFEASDFPPWVRPVVPRLQELVRLQLVVMAELLAARERSQDAGENV
jgi:hypothetical protein